MKTIIVDIISGIVVPITTLYVGYKININHSEKMETKRKKEDEEKLVIEEAKSTKRSVETFNRNIISKYIDFLNDGKAYDRLFKSAEKGATLTNFVDIRTLFEEEKIYRRCGKWDNDYDKIKNFYDTKVYRQYDGPDYVLPKIMLT